MLRRRHLALPLLLLSTEPAVAKPPTAWAYIGWWFPESWRSAPLPELDRLLFFELKINATGHIAERHGWPDKWIDLQTAVKHHNIPLDLTLTLFDVSVFEKLFTSFDAIERLLIECLELVSQDAVAGLQLDIEIYSEIRPDAVIGYRSFVINLAKKLRLFSKQKFLSIFFPIGGDSKIYDQHTLEYVDQLVLQGYDAHWKDGKNAGPIAPLTGADVVTWHNAVAQGLSLGVPKERMLLGFPLYGYEWPVQDQSSRSVTVGTGIATTFAPMPPDMLSDFPVSIQDRVKWHGSKMDTVSGSSFYQFKNRDGQFIEGWFEDQETLGLKVEYLKSESIGGIAFFMLGYDNGKLVEYYLKRRGVDLFPVFINKLFV